jgi:hypothetical protein
MKRTVRFLVLLALMLTVAAFAAPAMTSSCGSPFVSDGCPTPW